MNDKDDNDPTELSDLKPLPNSVKLRPQFGMSGLGAISTTEISKRRFFKLLLCTRHVILQDDVAYLNVQELSNNPALGYPIIRRDRTIYVNNDTINALQAQMAEMACQLANLQHDSNRDPQIEEPPSIKIYHPSDIEADRFPAIKPTDPNSFFSTESTEEEFWDQLR
ncbi:hypothetical protein BGZ76_011683 [Entomortierella beljakovae]|nr:hypothetical protein BGZ76_011683 [Entomortierella beljakovae]